MTHLPHRRLSVMQARARAGLQTGFSLIELMISITIGLVILAALVGVFASSSGNSKTNDRTSELLSNGRYALDSVKKEVREAGFKAYTWADPIAPGALGSVSNECLEAGAAATSFVGNFRQGVWGANNANPFAGSCIPAANYATGNDVLVVRRLAVLPTATASLSANGIYFLSNYERGQLFRGTTLPGWGTASPVPLPLGNFQLMTYVYYIRPWSVSATESPRVPALVRVALNPGATSDPSMDSELVATGIERMQVQYGRRTTAPDTQYLNAGQGALNKSSFVSDQTDWEDVNSVRIWLLARSTTAEPGLDPSANTYAMGDDSYTPPKDGFRRQLFSTVVQLRN